MKVCVVSHSSGLAGAERSLLELVTALRAGGVECRVLLPRRGLLESELRSRGIDYTCLPYTWWMSASAPWWKRLLKLAVNVVVTVPLAILIRSWRCDIVYTNSATVCVGAFAAWLARRRHVWQLREFEAGAGGFYRFDLGDRFSCHLIDLLSVRCVVASQALHDAYCGFITPAKIVVIPQAVSGPPHAPALPPAGVVFRFVIAGALIEGKRHHDAVRAIAAVIRAGVEAELFIFGTGDTHYTERLRRLAVEEDVNDSVRFCGEVQNIYPHLVQASAVLVCSPSESFGRVAVESMLAARAVLAPRGGALPELVQENVTGFLYPPGDWAELARLMVCLASEPDRAAMLGANGRAWAEQRFSETRYAVDLLRVMSCGLNDAEECIAAASIGSRSDSL